jgi:hypothetical protein
MRLGSWAFAIAAFALVACASSRTTECTQEQIEQSAVILKRMFAAGAYPSWLDGYSEITIQYVASGDWPCPGEAAIDPPSEGEAKPRARIKLYQRYCSQEPSAALGHILLHYERLNRKLFLQGGSARRVAEADADTFGARFQALDPK